MTDETVQPLPALYHRWAAEGLDGPIPRERAATCDGCAMAAPEGSAQIAFDPHLKCCTYHPRLSNFLVGAALADESAGAAEGRARLAARIAARAGVTPLAIEAPSASTAPPSSFGRDRDLLCPYYTIEDDRCSIFRHRNAVCATWFCKHDRGAVGQRFWSAARELFSILETALARWCLGQLDPGGEWIARDPDAPPDRGDDQEWRTTWGPFVDREAELYRATAALVAPLSLAQAVERAGGEAASALATLREAHRALLSRQVPPSLRPGPIELVQLDPRRARAVGYSGYDPVEMPRRLFDLLARFDGRSTDEVLAALAADGIRLTPALVRRLADFGLLVPG